MAAPKLTDAFLNRKAVPPHLPLPKAAISESVKLTGLAFRSTTSNDLTSSLLILPLDLPTSRSLITDLIFGWCGLMSVVCASP